MGRRRPLPTRTLLSNLHARGGGRRVGMAPPSPTARFLLGEDNPQDARLLQEAFRETAVQTQVVHCINAERAWKTLQEAMKSPATQLPDLLRSEERRVGKEC